MPHISASYGSYDDLAGAQVEGVDYRVIVRALAASPVAVIAPHGGGIELHSSDVATRIAGDEFNLYLFEGIREQENYQSLHLTSHKFDEPRCLELLSRCDVVVALHGCRGDMPQVYLGGSDEPLRQALARAIGRVGVPAILEGHKYPARHPLNICNRGRRGAGVQIEMTTALRFGGDYEAISHAIRSVLLELPGL